MPSPTPARGTRSQVPGMGRGADEPVFREPWEAQVFALAVALHDRGIFTWQQWSETLGEEIRRARIAGDPETGESHYRHWLAALERLLMARQVADPGLLARYRDAWMRAAGRTPHGQPITLHAGDFEPIGHSGRAS